MGDRANVVVKSGSEQVVLYTHWAGSELPEIVKAAMLRGRQRWDDFQYLTRIIFCQMVPQKYWEELTGYGITTQIHDGDRQVIVVDCDAGTVTVGKKQPMPFDSFASLVAAEW